MGTQINLCLQIICITTLSFYLDNTTLPMGLFTHQIGYNNTTTYLFGGRLSGTALWNNKVYKRDISKADMLWHNVTTTPSNLFYSDIQSSVTVSNIVYFLGVCNGTYNINEVITFDLISEQFVDNSIPSYRYSGYAGCVTTNKTHIFMIGGVTGPHAGELIYLNYIQILNIDLQQWSYKTISIKFWRQSCAMVNNTIYVFSGQNQSVNAMNSIYKFDTLTKEWIFVGNISATAKAGYAAYSPIDENIYIRGYEMMVFNPKQERIMYEQQIPVPVQLAPMTIYNDTLMIFGGAYNLEHVWNNDNHPYGPFQCTPLIQITKLPLVESQFTCTEDKTLLETLWIVLILLTMIIAICGYLLVNCYKKRIKVDMVNSNVELYHSADTTPSLDTQGQRPENR
eukprot:235541_1